MFTLTTRDNQKIPVERWIVELWVRDQLTNPYVLRVIHDAKQISGPWKELRHRVQICPTSNPKN